MKNPVILSLALACALAGCSTANVSGQSGGFPTTGTPQAGVSIQGGPSAGAIVTVAAIAVLIGMSTNSPSGRVPEMLEGRAINEVDCTQPIPDWSKNLKCK